MRLVKRAMECDYGWAKSAEKVGEDCVLHDPVNYPAILRALSSLEVTSVETSEENLETRYLSLMQKGDA